MKLKKLGYKHLIHLLSFSVLCLLVYSSSIGIAMGQKKPTSLKLDVDSDDKQICTNSSIKDSQFCDYYDAYNKTGATGAEKAQARNEMIELVRGQVDTYYKMRKDGKRTKIKWLQTLLDFLEVGAATAITIMNGERAKTVVGAALNGFQGGRTSFNKNFEILQTQVLINKMNTNRAQIFTEIVELLFFPCSINLIMRSYKRTDFFIVEFILPLIIDSLRPSSLALSLITSELGLTKTNLISKDKSESVIFLNNFVSRRKSLIESLRLVASI